MTGALRFALRDGKKREQDDDGNLRNVMRPAATIDLRKSGGIAGVGEEIEGDRAR